MSETFVNDWIGAQTPSTVIAHVCNFVLSHQWNSETGVVFFDKLIKEGAFRAVALATRRTNTGNGLPAGRQFRHDRVPAMLMALNLPNDPRNYSLDSQSAIEQEPAPENVLTDALDILNRRPWLQITPAQVRFWYALVLRSPLATPQRHGQAGDDSSLPATDACRVARLLLTIPDHICRTETRQLYGPGTEALFEEPSNERHVVDNRRLCQKALLIRARDSATM